MAVKASEMIAAMKKKAAAKALLWAGIRTGLFGCSFEIMLLAVCTPLAPCSGPTRTFGTQARAFGTQVHAASVADASAAASGNAASSSMFLRFLLGRTVSGGVSGSYTAKAAATTGGG